ncbi:MAG: acetyl-CoA carboxylase biotin carboxylase subunit [Bacteroidales bacterium]|nr:acetyl-CoA carboxylase biotin carboxylase subunit [Bacteroidales bacterium]
MSKINKILIANRGEIALRVMRTAKSMGIKTVAVYSEADRNSPHVRYADEAVLLGPPPSSESYLLGDKIIDYCKQLNVDAVHPGYGFLSENAEFAQAVTDAGIIFIGPNPEAIRLMGDKLQAKETVKDYDIPMIPGTDKAITDIEEAKDIAKDIGYPILIKAAAGGGGKGMRAVYNPEDFEEQMKTAVNEATSAFGNGSVFIEKFFTSPRHIEIQVMADSHGNTVYMFERECSVQRRHQKVIEEAPSAILTPEMRKKMGETAVNVAESCNYVGAGTVEFLYNEGSFYFLEMNTRLQVEHPVTELITGIDLVKEQILVAEGKELSFKQEDLKINGHAIELRVYAEDPGNNFLPDIGKLQKYKKPEGIGVRIDDGFEQGMDIPIYYDPMISKMCTFGRNREEAIEKMKLAIDDYEIIGVETTLSFGKFVMNHDAFISGDYSTAFVSNYFSPESLQQDNLPETEEIAAVIASRLFKQTHDKSNIKIASTGNAKSAWKFNRLQ